MNADLALSMSVLNAVLLLLDKGRRDNNTRIGAIISALEQSTTSTSSFDYVRAKIVILQCDGTFNIPWTDRKSNLRSLIRTVVQSYRPNWLHVVPLGRKYTRTYLDENIIQCLDSAGLWDDSEDSTIHEWWDSLALVARNHRDSSNLETGREGERLSYYYECQRVGRFGLSGLEVQWVAIEDNTLGYDISSYELVHGTPRRLTIEVKATKSNSIRFYITRHEWETAQRLMPYHRFHCWVLPTNTLHQFNAYDIAAHIPTDTGAGQWQTVEIHI